MVYTLRIGIGHVAGFISRQKHNYRVGVARSSADSFLLGLTSPYNAIYAVGLGADSVQLGALSSVGSAVSTLVSIPIGWLVDRWGVKPFSLLAITLSAGGILVYALTWDWRLLIIATVLASLSTRLTGTGCSVICADSVRNQDRATAQGLCGTLASLGSMLSPLIAAYLITTFGGLNTEGIRPLYYLRFAGYGLVFLLVLLKLQEPRRRASGRAGTGLVADFGQLFEGKAALRRWILIYVLTSLPMAMF
jgi:MFS family permease